MVAWCTRTWTNRFLHFLAVTLCCVLLMCCAMFKTGAKTAIEVTLAECVAEHPEAATEPELAKVCQYAAEYGPIVEQLLSAHKRGLARVAAAQRALHHDEAPIVVWVLVQDAGPPDASARDAGK